MTPNSVREIALRHGLRSNWGRWGADDQRGKRNLVYGSLIGFLSGKEAGALSHEELETRLATYGRELLCQLFKDHLNRRPSQERRTGADLDAAGAAHRVIEAGHCRGLETIVGKVTVTRLTYRARGAENLSFPWDRGGLRYAAAWLAQSDESPHGHFVASFTQPTTEPLRTSRSICSSAF